MSVVAAFLPGDVIGRRYRLIELLGAGAMGIVWSARNDAVDRGFAIKLMRPDATTNVGRVQRFFREAKAAGRLRHRCIIEVYDIGTIDEGEAHAGTPYLVMQLLEGEPLDALLKRLKRLPIGTALSIAADVARGLHRAHEQRIVHRDLKPGNLFLHKSIEEDGKIVPKILDFGVSKLLDKIDASETTIGTILGSPGYMSPEQSWGAEDLDGRADVWSLGVVLYKMLSGSLPFAASNFHAMLMAINSTDPVPLAERVPELPTEICDLVHKCLQKPRENRFQSALAFAEAAESLQKEHDWPTIDLAQAVRLTRARDSVKTTAGEPRMQGTMPLQTTAGEPHTQGTVPLPTGEHSGTQTAVASSMQPLPETIVMPPGDEHLPASVAPAPIAMAEGSEPSTLPRRSTTSRVASWMWIGAAVVAIGGAVVLVRATSSTDDERGPLPASRPSTTATTTSTFASEAIASPPRPSATSAEAPTTPPHVDSKTATKSTPTKPTSATNATTIAKQAPKTSAKPALKPTAAAAPTTADKPAEDPAHEGILHAGF